MKLKRSLLLIPAAILVGGAGWLVVRTFLSPSPRGAPSLPAKTVTVGETHVTLYFADADTGLLIPVQRRISQSRDDPQTVLRELVAGPRPDEKGVSALPKGTEVLGTSLTDGGLTVNLNWTFQKDSPSSSAASLLAVYSIVNTLTGLPGVQKVAFEIEGKRVSVLGPLDVSEPLASKPDMIAR